MWNLVKKIFPQNYLNSISSLHIFSTVASESQTTADVIEVDNTKSKFVLGFAIDFAYFILFDAQKYFTTTLIQELAHVISFSADQYDFNPCDQPLGNEFSCLKVNSYLRLYGTALFDDYVNLDQAAFYNKNSERFSEF